MTIYLLCPKPGTPSGGVWFISRLTQLLNEIGQEAYVWTPDPFDVYWDAHPIDSKYVRQSIQPGRGDTLIVPEVNWPVPDMPGIRQILLVQNYIWLNQYQFSANPGETLVCSRFLANYMQRVFGAKVIGKITPFLDDDVWQPSPKETNRTLLFARRNDYHPLVKQALEANGFPVEYVTENLTQRQISEKLSRCEFYVHLTHPEGFPMACLEAMRSGTIVVGTTGGGGVEFMHDRETAMCVQDPDNGRYGDAGEFVRRIVERMNELKDDAEKRSRIWQAAHTWSLRYTAEATKKELQGVFS